MQPTIQSSFNPMTTRFAAASLSGPAGTGRVSSPAFSGPIATDRVQFGSDGDNGAKKGERTRMQNLGVLMKHAFTKGLIRNVISGTVIGGIIAALSGGLMAPITIPATIGILFGLNIISNAAIALSCDPNGDFMTRVVDVLENGHPK